MATCTLELLTHFCVQSHTVKKCFELGEDGLKDILKKKEQWEKQKKEADELMKKVVSYGF